MMYTLAPSYYPAFRCIADRCRHTCCAGWEIDIDDDTAQRYRLLPGGIGTAVREAMVEDEEGIVHFRLDREERCPMLTEQGLCRLITACGEDALCQICADHPRYRSFFSDHTEIGLGLCCEEAARLILTQREPAGWICINEDDGTDAEPDDEEEAILSLREALIRVMQDRTVPVCERAARIEGQFMPEGLPPLDQLYAELAGLERLDPAWGTVLDRLLQPRGEAIPSCYDTPLEQLMVSLVMRHLPGAVDDGLLEERVCLCLLLWHLVYALFERGPQSMEELIELSRMMSS